MRARAALTVVVAVAGAVTAINHHTFKPPAFPSAGLAEVVPLHSLPAKRHKSPGTHRTPNPRASRGTPRHLSLIGGEYLDITAYCETGSRTASGLWPHLGMAAGNRWPFGTVLHVAGYGDVTIQDRIGWGSDLDLYFGDYPDCQQRAATFGRRHLRVVVER